MTNHHYSTIAAAIRHVRATAGAQPSLDAIAAHVGLSPTHLQRVFSEFAGVSPKRFLQFLTKEHARHLLRESCDVLTTTLESGLSSPSRLHDLMVSCEAMTPGEIGALGRGLTIRHGFADSPLGPLLVGLTARGICHLAFVDDASEAARDVLLADWPQAGFVADDAAAQAVAQMMFRGKCHGQPLHLLLKGTNFQIKVWEALLRIPAGHAVSYGQLAASVGMPNAQRAVGSAVAANRIAVLIPCHRVLRESGDFSRYRWQPERKLALLAREAGQREVLA